MIFAMLLALAQQSQGIPYVFGGDSPAGTDCSGIVSWLANQATGRPIYGDRFDTGSEGAALAGRGFLPGDAPGALATTPPRHCLMAPMWSRMWVFTSKDWIGVVSVAVDRLCCEAVRERD